MGELTAAERTRMRTEFVRLYGTIGEMLDEDEWLDWYGVWVMAWAAALNQEDGEVEDAGA